MKIAFVKPELPETGSLAVGVMDGRKLGTHAAQVEKLTKGAVNRAIGASRFKGGTEDHLALLAPAGVQVNRVLLIGLGTAQKLDALAAQAIGGRLVAAFNAAGEKEATVLIEAIPGAPLSEAEIAANIAYGAQLRSYRFDKYKSKEKPDHKPTFKKLTIGTAEAHAAKKAYDPLEKIGEGVFMTRDLVSEPANVIYPETLAQEAKTLSEVGVEV
jgi:leucyl aminopeptidase